MSEDKAKGIRVEALKYHTFGNPSKEYNAGDKYTVHGDSSQTADQYVDTLRALGHAKPVGEESALVVEEVPEPAGNDRGLAEKQADKKDADKKDAPKKSTHVEPMGTADLKAVAESKTVEHRKQNVPTVKK